MKISGFIRENGTYGIRNHLLVIPTSVCASETASRIAREVTGAVAIPHQHGCCQMGADHETTVRTLIGFGKNPNVGAVLVVALGCEGIEAGAITAGVKEAKKPVGQIVIQQCGGTVSAVQQGVRIAQAMAAHLSQQKRESFDLSELTLALECGGSDPTSGVTANPIMGEASDRLIAHGGSSILSETTEVIGAEHILKKRFLDPLERERFLNMVSRVEARASAAGQDLRATQPTPGNKAGGLSTIEEKSLGCMFKAGSSPFLKALAYAEELPKQKGLYFMDTPGQDIESITGMVAGGAQLVAFSTGRGTPTGCAIAPVIKITGNAETYQRMEENIDINAGRVIAGGESIEALGKELFAELVAVANGKLTKAECLGYKEFAIFREYFTF